MAHKYEMDSALAHIRAAIASQDPPFIRPETSFHIYSLAQTHGLRHEMLLAARATLAFSITIEDLEDKLDAMKGGYLYELWKHHRRVRTILGSNLKVFRTTSAHGALANLCRNCSWLDGYLRSIWKASAVFDLHEFYGYLVRHAFDSQCKTRLAIPTDVVCTYVTALKDVIVDSTTKAGLTCHFIERLGTTIIYFIFRQKSTSVL